MLEFWSNLVGAIALTEIKEVEDRFRPYIDRLVVHLYTLCKFDQTEVSSHRVLCSVCLLLCNMAPWFHHATFKRTNALHRVSSPPGLRQRLFCYHRLRSLSSWLHVSRHAKFSVSLLLSVMFLSIMLPCDRITDQLYRLYLYSVKQLTFFHNVADFYWNDLLIIDSL